jgi:NTP pyrophosphatase (non-canonical NTP hydrolase)
MSLHEEFEDLVKQVVEWHDREWPATDGTPAELSRIFMKSMEEFGELSGALVKHLQGRKDEDWLLEAHKEFGDLLITLMMIHNRMQWLEAEAGARPVTPFMDRFGERWFGLEPGGGVRDRRGASYRNTGADHLT